MARRPLAAAVIACLVTAVAGCTSSGAGSNSAGDFQGEQRRVAQVVEDLESAGSKGDQDAICSQLLAPALVARLDARGGCRPVVDATLKDTDTFDLKVESVSITGDRAVARVTTDTGDRKRTAALRLVRRDNAWKVAGLPG